MIMKKAMVFFATVLMVTLFSCKKDSQSSISLTASASTLSVGQPLTVTLNSTANTSKWTVSPTTNATQAYSVTTNKANYFTFSAAGTYTISVKVRDIVCDTTRQSLESAWNLGGRSGRPGCDGDTASVSVTVTK